MRIVVKIGSSSLTDESGGVNLGAITSVCKQVATARQAGHSVIVVTSGAIAAGLPAMGVTGPRPKDSITLQAAASVGQPLLMRSYDNALATHGLIGGQILLTPHNFFVRREYLRARDTLERLLGFGVVPLVNENDAVSDDEIGFGDNDRLAALVANALKADLLLLLTDADGLFTADPRLNSSAELIEDVAEIDESHLALASGSGSERGTGGMLSKLTAARMASWSGVEVVIAAASRPDVIVDTIDGKSTGTKVHKHSSRLSARKVWIAFALSLKGTVTIDTGAAEALRSGKSLLAAGVTSVGGKFDSGDGVAVVDGSGTVLARGMVGFNAAELANATGKRTAELPAHLPKEVINRDDLVLL